MTRVKTGIAYFGGMLAAWACGCALAYPAVRTWRGGRILISGFLWVVVVCIVTTSVLCLGKVIESIVTDRRRGFTVLTNNERVSKDRD